MDTSLYTPTYTSLYEVKLELKEKVNFKNDSSEGVSDNEVLDNIEDAESTVELELSRQYITPFSGVDDSGNLIPFSDISVKTTRKFITKLCLLQSCLLVMQTVFGQAEGVRGRAYIEFYQDQLDRMMQKVIGTDEKSGQYLYPPLPGLATNDYASYFKPGIPMPMTASVGVNNPNYGNQVLSRMPNAVSNWFFRGYPYGRYYKR